MEQAVRPESPDFFADRPATARDDLLSSLLRSVRLRGQDIGTFRGPEPLESDGHWGALHLVEAGALTLELADGRAESAVLASGDVALIPQGCPCRITPVDGGARWLTGTFEFDQRPGSALAGGLPVLAILRNAEVSKLEWFDVSRRLLVREREHPTQGSAVMISRILDLLFVQVLRAWASGPRSEAGWLRAALDPQVGLALDALHAEPGRAWTTKTLAAEAHLARSTFNERFSRTVGEAPMAYLTRARMDVARTMLRTGSATVREIAAAVGYTSEAAFTRAFAKEHGQPPSRWRRSENAGRASGWSPGVTQPPRPRAGRV